MDTKQNWRLDWLALAALGGIAAVVWLALRGTAIDDPYITYRYAGNVARGLGLVYNQGERVLSSTTPFYALLLGMTAFFGVDLPGAGSLLSGLFLFAAGGAIYYLGRRFADRALGFGAAAILVLSPLLAGSLGLETCFYLFLILAAFSAYAYGRLTLVAVFFALAVMTRGDAAIPMALVAVYHLFTTRRVPWRPLAVFVVITLPFFAFLTVAYGTPLPATLAAKQAQLRIGWLDYLQGAGSWMGEYFRDSSLYAGVPVCILLGLVSSFRERRWILFVAGWAILHAAAYQALGVASYYWYYAPLLPAVALLVAAGLALVVSTLRQRLAWFPLRRHLAYPVLLLVAAMPLAAAETTTLARTVGDLPDARAESYRQVGDWLRENTPGEATVGVMEVGIIGYYAERRMIDFLGLIEPDSVKALRHKDIFWSLYHYQPDYLVLNSVNPLWGYPVLGDAWFQEAYQPVARFENPRFWAAPLLVYRRALPVRPPLTTPREVDLTFGGQLELRKLAVDRESARPGDFLTAALSWRRAARPAQDYAVTVQLIGEDGRLLAQDDVTTASSIWERDEVVQHYHHVKIPATAPPGSYRLIVAVYPPADPLRRLPVGGYSAADFADLVRIVIP